MDKRKMFEMIEDELPRMTETAFAIYDHPEIDGEEYKSSELLQDRLREEGFSVESGIAELPTAFRAVKKIGSGSGPNIGILGEFDALRGIGHACGHHLQTPAAIAALKAAEAAARENGLSCTLTLYGTPAEETFGGKVRMAKAGYFRELDAALGCHAAQANGVTGTNYAIRTYTYTFHGRRAHAAGAPDQGRSALDAMLLTFNGIEFLREHVRETTRMYYSVRQEVMPANVVPAAAVTDIGMRSFDTHYLHEELEPRVENVVRGASIMTDTTYEKTLRTDFESTFPNLTLNALAVDNMRLLYPEEELPKDMNGSVSRGSTDFGNVCHIVPTGYVKLFFTDKGAAHSQAWLEEGKTEAAVRYMSNSAKLLAAMILDLLTKPELLQRAKAEFEKNA